MKALIYAIGQRFHFYFDNLDFCNWMKQQNFEIVGLADGNPSMHGNLVELWGEKREIRSLAEYEPTTYDKIVVTSDIHYIKIKTSLMEAGYQEDMILPLDYFIAQYADNYFNLKNISGKIGVEVGGPSQVFAPIYGCCAICDGVNYSADTVWWKAEDRFCFLEKVLGKTIIADATDLHEIPEGFYDFVLSSNNLEHIANPLKALTEFKRICKKDGLLYVLVPWKEATFDHNREYTSFEHILEDFKKNVQEDDLTHLPEIIQKHDYAMDPECGGKEKFLLRSQENFKNRCLHHHVFSENCLKQMYEYLGMEVVTISKYFGNILMIGRVTK